nr:tetratricopeptide repeat domain-containing protein PYG7, chloroplastic isoform X2 [Tanacetum cinerariifolium]
IHSDITNAFCYQLALHFMYQRKRVGYHGPHQLPVNKGNIPFNPDVLERPSARVNVLFTPDSIEAPSARVTNRKHSHVAHHRQHMTVGTDLHLTKKIQEHPIVGPFVLDLKQSPIVHQRLGSGIKPMVTPTSASNTLLIPPETAGEREGRQRAPPESIGRMQMKDELVANNKATRSVDEGAHYRHFHSTLVKSTVYELCDLMLLFQKLVQLYNAMDVSYIGDKKIDNEISQVETAVKIQPEYVMPWNNLAEAYEKKKQYKYAIRTFQEALLFEPNNKLTL